MMDLPFGATTGPLLRAALSDIGTATTEEQLIRAWPLGESRFYPPGQCYCVVSCGESETWRQGETVTEPCSSRTDCPCTTKELYPTFRSLSRIADRCSTTNAYRDPHSVTATPGVSEQRSNGVRKGWGAAVRSPEGTVSQRISIRHSPHDILWGSPSDTE